MFKEWLEQNNLSDIDFSSRLFPRATNREFWEGVTKVQHIDSAEQLLGYEWPLVRASQFMEFHKSGDRLAQENPHFARRNALLTLVMGEIAEYKGRFLPDICDGIFVICEETYWGLSAHSGIIKTGASIPDAAEPYIDLMAAETAELLAVTYHILYDTLHMYCPEILARMEYEIDRRIVVPYLNHGDYWWMGNMTQTVNNWNPWILSNILTVFLTLNLRRTTFDEGIKKMFTEIDRYYDCMPADGGCDEGANYWKLAGGKLFSFCDQLYIASSGKVDFFKDEKLRRIGHYEVKAYIGGCYFVNFADGNTSLKDDQIDYELYGFGLRTGDESFCRMAATLKRHQSKCEAKSARLPHSGSIKSELYSLIYAEDIDKQADFVPENEYILPDLQCAFMRAGEWFYAAKGGNNAESHNHNDVGNFIVYHQGLPVLIDAGCGVYTKFTFDGRYRYTIWTMQSGWHNLPVFNGVEQVEGITNCADSFTVDGSTTSVSFASAYPKEAGVNHADRKISIQENGVTVDDVLNFNGNDNTVEEHFLTILKPEVTSDGVLLGGKYLLKTSLSCKIEWKDFEGDSKLKNSWETEGLYRISLYTSGGEDITISTEIRSI